MRCLRNAILFTVSVVISGGLGVADQRTRAWRPIVIAHRGASGYLPEHTLAAKSMAYTMQADYLEQDVVLTKDHVPVVLHDIHIDTVSDVAEKFPRRARADGRFYAIDFDLAELKTLNVMERIDHRTGKPVFPNRFPISKKLGFTIPTLAEEIELVQGLNKSTGKNVGIYPEVKQPEWHRAQGADLSSAVLKVLAEFGYVEASSQVYLQCFDPRELKRIRFELQCRLKLIQLIGEGQVGETDYDAMLTNDGLREIAEYAEGIGPSMRSLYDVSDYDAPITSNLVARAHRADLKVHPYTIRIDALPPGFRSMKALANFLSESRVDGAFTDFPDITRSMFHDRKSD